MTNPDRIRLDADRAYVVADEASACKLACRFCFVDAAGYSSATTRPVFSKSAHGVEYIMQGGLH